MIKKSFLKIKIRTILSKILLFYIAIWIYIPIIAGIFLPMIFFVPLAYVSWRILELWGSNSWYDSWFVINPENTFMVELLFIIELIIFIGGLLLFGWSLYHLVKARRYHVKIAKTGPYKLIRHPQNLSIIIMLFPFTLYIPGFSDIGIRSGEIISWMIFSLCIIMISIIEEQGLKKRYPEEFKSYRSNTGFFIPKLIHTKSRIGKLDKFRYTLRYGSLILGLIICITIAYFLTEDLIKVGILCKFK
jgi:protein-S-isoprenylcysteine O-methyltransferase Ste14